MSPDRYEVWWNHAEAEDTMEAEHLAGWQQMINMIKEEDLSNRSILDFGCNRGGFLRQLYQAKPYKQAVGIDLGIQSIAIADTRKADLPIRYEVSGEPDRLDATFDLAFSLSVLYLIDDVAEHARKMSRALNKGGVYYVTYMDLSDNPSRDYFKQQIETYSHLHANAHTVSDIAQAFAQAGFEVEVKRKVPTDFVPVDTNASYFRTIADELLAVYEQSYVFRFTRK